VLSLIHTSQITTKHTRSSQSVTVFTSRFLITASNCGLSLVSGFRNYPRLQIPVSQSNSPQRLNCNSVTHSLRTNSLQLSEWVSYFTTDCQSASLSWNKAPIWGFRLDFFINVRQLRVCWCRAPSLTRGRVCLLLCTMYNIFAFYMLSCVIHSLT
jgi:hypothetical protein